MAHHPESLPASLRHVSKHRRFLTGVRASSRRQFALGELREDFSIRVECLGGTQKVRVFLLVLLFPP